MPAVARWRRCTWLGGCLAVCDALHMVCMHCGREVYRQRLYCTVLGCSQETHRHWYWHGPVNVSQYFTVDRPARYTDKPYAAVSHMGAHCLCSCTCQHQIMAAMHLPVASRRCQFGLQLMSQCTSIMVSCSCVCSWCIFHMLAVTRVEIESRVELY